MYVHGDVGMYAYTLEIYTQVWFTDCVCTHAYSVHVYFLNGSDRKVVACYSRLYEEGEVDAVLS